MPYPFLQSARVIAVVGASDKPYRPSLGVYRNLKRVGYTVYPVNPNVAQVDGDRAYASLADVPEPIDIVNVFRRPEHLRAVVDEAIAVGAKAIGGQFGVSDPAAEAKARAAGLEVVVDRCIMIEHRS
jgi:hypothetical protein